MGEVQWHWVIIIIIIFYKFIKLTRQPSEWSEWSSDLITLSSIRVTPLSFILVFKGLHKCDMYAKEVITVLWVS